MAAPLALQSDICPQPDHSPFIRTTRVGFAQAKHIVQLEIGKHLVPT